MREKERPTQRALDGGYGATFLDSLVTLVNFLTVRSANHITGANNISQGPYKRKTP
jgi:hypothetical protein